MATKLRNAGMVYTPTASRPLYQRKVVLNLSNGNAVAVLADTNDTGTTTGYGEQNNTSKFYIYESSDRVTWTLRLTITLASTLMKSVRWSAEVFSNNDIGIVYKLSTSDQVAYRKITYATWTAGAEELVKNTPIANRVNTCVDIAITDGDIPVVAIFHAASDLHNTYAQVYTRRTSDNTWFNSLNQITLTGTFDAYDQYIAINAVKGVGSSTARAIMVATSQHTNASDPGVRVYSFTINESTGAIPGSGAGALAQQALLGASTLPVAVTNWVGPPRVVSLFSQANGQMTVGIISSRSVNNKTATIILARYAWDGTTFSTLIQPQTYLPPILPNLGYGAAISVGIDSLSFLFSHPVNTSQGDNKFYIVNYIAKIDSVNNTVKFFDATRMIDSTESTVTQQIHLFGNTGKNLSRKMDFLFFRYPQSNTYEYWHEYNKTTRAPAAVTPAAGSTTISSVPAISIDADLDRALPQAPIKVVWQFASDSGFTTSVRTYTQDDTKYVIVAGTNQASVVVKINDTVPDLYSMPQGTWYVRAAHLDAHGNQGTWSAGQSFTISHAPAAVNTIPEGDQFLLFGTSGNVQFSWDFTDPSPVDHQTAFEVVVERVSDGSTVLDSGKITSTATSWIGAISATYKEVQLRWKVRLWDGDDVAGSYSATKTFYVGDPLTVTATSPADNDVLATGMPLIVFETTVPANRTLVSYRVVAMQGSVVAFDSGDVAIPGNLGGYQSIQFQPSSPILANHKAYTIQVSMKDSLGLTSSVDNVPVTTQWLTPAGATGLTVDTSPFNVEGSGYVLLTWDDTSRDADFQKWIVYRQDNEIDTQTHALLAYGDWQQVGEVYDINTAGYSFKDFYAPSGMQVVYRVGQQVNRFGDTVESDDQIYNYSTNPSFEADIARITMLDSYLQGPIADAALTDVSNPKSTKQLARMVVAGPNPTLTLQGNLPTPNTNRMPIHPGQTAYFRVRVRNDSNVNGAATAAIRWLVSINLYDSSGTNLGGSGTPYITTALGDTAEATISMLVDSSFGTDVVAWEPRIQMTRTDGGALPNNTTGAIDSIIATRGAMAYFDGNYAGAAWVGTPEQSASYQPGMYQDVVTGYPASEGYWMISPEDPDSGGTAFKLAIVTADSYADEYEEEEYIIVGRGRHVDRGEKLGVKGTLSLQVRDTYGGPSARQQKQRLQLMKENNRTLYLRNPFGDVYRVSAGNMTITRLAGVGLSEFCDVEIPYSEVGV